MRPEYIAPKGARVRIVPSRFIKVTELPRGRWMEANSLSKKARCTVPTAIPTKLPSFVGRRRLIAIDGMFVIRLKKGPST